MKKAVIMVALASMGVGFWASSPKAMADGYVNYNYSSGCNRCSLHRTRYIRRTVSKPVLVRRTVSRPVYVEQVVSRPVYVTKVRPVVYHSYHRGLIPRVYQFIFGG